MTSPLAPHTLRAWRGARKRKKIVGRGDSSGQGSYSGRGIKGQKSRTGGKKGLAKLGLRTLLAQTPKQGGFPSRRAKTTPVSLSILARHAPPGGKVDLSFLKEKGLIPVHSSRVKVLGRGGAALSKPLTIEAHAFSASAQKAIEAAGGTAVVKP